MAYPFLNYIAKRVLFEVFRTGTLIKTVARDWTNELAVSGETVTVVVPEIPAVRAIGSATTVSSVNPSTIEIKLDKAFETEPKAVDIVTLSKADGPVLDKYALPIAQALVEKIETDILAEAAGFTEHVGTPTTGSAMPATIADFVAYKQKFDALKAPMSERFMIAGPELELAYFGVFPQNSVTGQSGVTELTTGVMDTRMGATWLPNAAAEDATSKLIGYGWQKNGIALACRPMTVSPLANGNMVTYGWGGIGITLEMFRLPLSSQDCIRGQVLYGTKALSGKGFQAYKK